MASKSVKSSQDIWLKPNEAARLLGVTERCLRYWARLGKIVATRTAGGHYRYSMESVLEMIQARNGSAERSRTAALYARGLHHRHIWEQLSALRRAAGELGYPVVCEEYDLQGGHRMGLGLQRLLVGAQRQAFRVVLITSYSRLGWWGAADPRFFHLVFGLFGVQLIPLLAFEERASPRELIEDFQAIHEGLREYLNRNGRGANRKILRALEMIRRGYPVEEELID